MWNLMRVLPVLVVTGLGAYALGGSSVIAQAATPKVNACGCYRDAAGACFCGKKGKCDCPGDCEPKGCEEKRIKDMDKEVEAETKRAREAEKKQRDEAEEKRKKAEAAARAEEDAASGSASDSAEGQAGEDEGDEAKGKKAKKSKKSKKAKAESGGE